MAQFSDATRAEEIVDEIDLNSPAAKSAQRTVASYATDAADAARLLAMLGLDGAPSPKARRGNREWPPSSTSHVPISAAEVTTAPDPEDWRARAECSDPLLDPEKWFPLTTGAKAADEAREICTDCPVRVDCGTEAAQRNYMYGVYAGYHLERPQERRELRDEFGGPRPKTSPQPIAGTAGDTEQRSCAACGKEFTTSQARLRCRACELGKVPADAARAHIKKLRALNAPYVDIAESAKVPLHTVKQIAYGAVVNTSPETLAAILAVSGIGSAVPA